MLVCLGYNRSKSIRTSFDVFISFSDACFVMYNYRIEMNTLLELPIVQLSSFISMNINLKIFRFWCSKLIKFYGLHFSCTIKQAILVWILIIFKFILINIHFRHIDLYLNIFKKNWKIMLFGFPIDTFITINSLKCLVSHFIHCFGETSKYTSFMETMD